MNLTLFDKLFRLKAIKWQKILESKPLLKMVLNRVILVVTDGLNKELYVGVHLFAKDRIIPSFHRSKVGKMRRSTY